MYAAGFHVDEVLCVLPRKFPHKSYFGATLEDRLEMLRMATGEGAPPPVSIAVADGGLFLDIARECREHYGAATELVFLCGADAAQRILSWDYGRPGAAVEMLREFELLVAPRGDPFEPTEEFRDRIQDLYLRNGFHLISSTEVRERIKARQAWEHLVPGELVEKGRRIY